MDEVWSLQERLVLAHAVERLGNNNWNGVVRALRKATSAEDTGAAPARAFSVKSCSREYTRMLEEWTSSHPREAVSERRLARDASEERLTQLRMRVMHAEARINALLALVADPSSIDVHALCRKRARVERDALEEQHVPQPFAVEALLSLPSWGDVGKNAVGKPNPASASKTDARLLLSVFESIAGHKMAGVFQEPVTEEVAPGYSAAVLRPVSLREIRSQLHDGTIVSIMQLHRALTLMLTNACLFNASGSEVHRMALAMLECVRRECEPLLAAEMLAKK